MIQNILKRYIKVSNAPEESRIQFGYKEYQTFFPNTKASNNTKAKNATSHASTLTSCLNPLTNFTV